MCLVVAGELDHYMQIRTNKFANTFSINNNKNDVPIMRDVRYSSWLQNLLISSLLSPR